MKLRKRPTGLAREDQRIVRGPQTSRNLHISAPEEVFAYRIGQMRCHQEGVAARGHFRIVNVQRIPAVSSIDRFHRHSR